jgi:hypothetical protein
MFTGHQAYSRGPRKWVLKAIYTAVKDWEGKKGWEKRRKEKKKEGGV